MSNTHASPELINLFETYTASPDSIGTHLAEATARTLVDALHRAALIALTTARVVIAVDLGPLRVGQSIHDNDPLAGAWPQDSPAVGSR